MTTEGSFMRKIEKLNDEIMNYIIGGALSIKLSSAQYAQVLSFLDAYMGTPGLVVTSFNYTSVHNRAQYFTVDVLNCLYNFTFNGITKTGISFDFATSTNPTGLFVNVKRTH